MNREERSKRRRKGLFGAGRLRSHHVSPFTLLSRPPFLRFSLFIRLVGASGTSKRRRTLRAQGDRGFTLMEVLIVIVIIALVTVVSVMGLRSFAKTDLRNTSARMAGAIRYLFDRASTTGKVHRLVIDFEQRKYWAEVSDDPFIFAGGGKETEESRQKLAEKIAKEEQAKKEAEEKEAFFGNAIPSKYIPKPFVPKRARFGTFREMAVKPVALKSSVVIDDMYTPRLDKPIAEGRGYLYFFPLGMTEAAIIHLSDPKKETFYSLVVHPLNGRVSVKSTFVEVTGEQFDDLGKAVVQ